MSDVSEGAGAGFEGFDSALEEVDPDLNIFALANGLDLEKHPQRGERILIWYRDRMERFLRLAPSEDGEGMTLSAEAALNRDAPQRARAVVRENVPLSELRSQIRSTLESAVERANAFTRDDLDG